MRDKQMHFYSVSTAHAQDNEAMSHPADNPALDLISVKHITVGKQSRFYGVPVFTNRTFNILYWVLPISFGFMKQNKYGFHKKPFAKCPY